MRARGRAETALSPGPPLPRLNGKTRSLLKRFYWSFGALLPSSPLPLTALHPVLGVHIARVGAFAPIDQVPEATFTVDNIITPTTVLLIVFVTTAYLVVAPQGVDVVSEFGAHDLLACVGAGYVFGQGSPAGCEQHRSHQSKH